MRNPTDVPARERIDFDEAARLSRLGVLFRMERRSRPRYFDGRFLAARDLIRDQGYFLARQADLGHAIGAGVVSGLTVRRSPNVATELIIDAGHGVTPAGEMVALATQLRIRLGDLPTAQRLDAAFGIRVQPQDPPRNRTGVYVLALRPVEFSANPIAAYPTKIEGPRTVEDGDIIEGAVATLIPYPVEGNVRDGNAVRARVEREVFLLGNNRVTPVAALPLAMVGLIGDAVTWLDPFLVRREIGLEHRDILGLGFAPRALREAHLLQYQHRLAELDLPGRASFPATTYFDVLPPGGRIPKAAINPQDFSQRYFPPEVDVDLAVIPDDELPAMIEDSLLLPPIDLNLSDAELDSLAIMALIPVPRSSVQRLQTELGQLTRTLRPAAPNLIAKRLPLEVLRGIRLPRILPPVLDTTNVVDAAWQRVLGAAPSLWYVRRRNIAYKAAVTGVASAVTAPERDLERGLNERLQPLNLTTRVGQLRTRATALGATEMVNLLSSPKFVRSPELLPIAVKELEDEKELDRAAVLRVAERYSQPSFGEGLARIKTTQPALLDDAAVKKLAAAGKLADLDRIGATFSQAKLAELGESIGKTAKTRRPDALIRFVDGQSKDAKGNEP